MIYIWLALWKDFILSEACFNDWVLKIEFCKEIFHFVLTDFIIELLETTKNNNLLCVLNCLIEIQNYSLMLWWVAVYIYSAKVIIHSLHTLHHINKIYRSLLLFLWIFRICITLIVYPCQKTHQKYLVGFVAKDIFHQNMVEMTTSDTIFNFVLLESKSKIHKVNPKEQTWEGYPEFRYLWNL